MYNLSLIQRFVRDKFRKVKSMNNYKIPHKKVNNHLLNL
jgi:hypothetical protein